MSRARLFTLIATISLAPAWTAAAEDRYGPPGPAPTSEDAAAPIALLTWPGKAATAPIRRDPPPAAVEPVAPAPLRMTPISTRPAPVYRRWSPDVAPAQPASIYAPPPAAAVQPIPAALPAASSVSSYAPRPAAANQAASNPVASSQTFAGQTITGQPPHRYSVDREYGIQPDPTPLPSQFFAEASDMAAPPPLPPPHTVNGQNNTVAAMQARTAANDADAQGADSLGSN